MIVKQTGIRLASLVMMMLWLAATVVGQSHTVEYSPRRLNGNNVTCTFEVLAQASYNLQDIEHDVPRVQSKPLIIAFTNIDSKTPSARSVGVTNDSDEVKVVSFGTSDKRVLIDMTASDNVDVWIVYRDSGVAVWTRNYENPLLPMPTDRVGVGRCHD